MLDRRELLAGALASVGTPADRQLAPLTRAVIAWIARRSRRLVEIGAGDGYWARPLRAAGVEVAAYDIEPRGPGVIRGSHLDAALAHPGWPMLAVWPPDGASISRWIAATPWPEVYVVADHQRLWFGDALAGYAEIARLALPDGYEGSNELVAWRR
ncbi:MAG: methyltransferase domain-containing protein [Pseudomonadota bacterium]